MNPGFRAHHIFCVPHLDTNFSDRGEDFDKVEKKIKNIMASDDPDVYIKIKEGADELCITCPLCIDEKCISPKGDEAKVRKWDLIILKELGLNIGQILSVSEIKQVIKQKAPLKLCFKCQWKTNCNMGKKAN